LRHAGPGDESRQKLLPTGFFPCQTQWRDLRFLLNDAIRTRARDNGRADATHGVDLLTGIGAVDDYAAAPRQIWGSNDLVNAIVRGNGGIVRAG
jgi:hypothetical protein